MHRESQNNISHCLSRYTDEGTSAIIRVYDNTVFEWIRQSGPGELQDANIAEKYSSEEMDWLVRISVGFFTNCLFLSLMYSSRDSKIQILAKR